MKKLLAITTLCLLPLLILGQSAENKYSPLLDAAKKSNSDALVILEDGKKVLEYYPDSKSEKIESMSVTKSVVGLAVAKLLSDGVIDSLDTPVAHFYPEWRQGRKRDITIRHLMNHTSGLQNVANANKEVNPAHDALQLGLCASVVDEPGTEFSYNNKAVNILAGIIREATDKPIDGYLSANLFKQMGITDFTWGTDKAGNHYAMGGLAIHARDLAKLGQLVLNEGSWNEKQLIDKKWIEKVLAQGPPENRTYGLLWWRIPEEEIYKVGEQQIEAMKESGMNKNMLTKIKEIQGEYNSLSTIQGAFMSQFDSKEKLMQFRKATIGKGIDPYTKSLSGPIIGYKASGDAGQYMVIYPKLDLVAVRMIKVSKNYNPKTDSFSKFPRTVLQLARSK